MFRFPLQSSSRAGAAHMHVHTFAICIAFSVAVIASSAPDVALAGRASSGELLFYPCTSCHPVTPGGPSRELPNKFKKHSVVLVGHEKLGPGDEACLACHDDPAKDPGKLRLASGALTDIKGDIAGVCYRCHSDKHKAWKAGAHGKGDAQCTTSGCHDPHTPSWFYASPVRPFLGSGFQFGALSQREEFSPMAPPPPPPPVHTPGWLPTAALVGFLAAAVQVSMLVRGRSKV